MVHYKNDQWAVTKNGLQSVKPGAPYEYFIEASRLLEMGPEDRSDIYDWPIHLAEKEWVDLEAFIDAYRRAIEFHKGTYKGEFDPEVLLESIDRAHKEREYLSQI